jgi:hypothetical protein
MLSTSRKSLTNIAPTQEKGKGKSKEKKEAGKTQDVVGITKNPTTTTTTRSQVRANQDLLDALNTQKTAAAATAADMEMRPENEGQPAIVLQRDPEPEDVTEKVRRELTTDHDRQLFECIIKEQRFEFPKHLEESTSPSYPVTWINAGRDRKRIIARYGDPQKPYYNYASEDEFPGFADDPDLNVMKRRRGQEKKNKRFTWNASHLASLQPIGLTWLGSRFNITDTYSRLLCAYFWKDGKVTFEKRSFMERISKDKTEEIIEFVADQSVQRGRSAGLLSTL